MPHKRIELETFKDSLEKANLVQKRNYIEDISNPPAEKIWIIVKGL
jgi:hypothetical protein